MGLTYTPLLAGWPVLAVISGAREVAPTTALAALAAEAQVFATFALLTPLFFMSAQFYRPGKHLLQDLTTTVVGTIMLSIFGIGMSIVVMAFEVQLLFVILFLLLIVAQVAFLISLFLMNFAGFKRIQNWMTSERAD